MNAAERHAPRRRPERPGFTLLEAVLSAAVLAVLMGAMVASVAIASRAADGDAGPAGRQKQAAALIGQIEADLATAMAFRERTPSAVTFTVPDRDADGRDEVIRYAWSGPTGGQLTRRLNGDPPAVIAEDVRQFHLTFLTRTMAPPGP